jgi:GTP diphosphokinase / guanosine-3',5'-bis(diphosphate) 3'-diphosphatase
MKHSCSDMKSSVEDFALLLKAFKFAAFKHRDQRRKDERASPYINHPIAVAETLWETGGIRDVTTLVAGILHDIIEDTDTSPEELEQEFGAEVCNLVKELTDDKELPNTVRKRLQLENIANLSRRARYVRIADKISNVEDIVHSPPARWSLERREEYVIWAGKVIDGLRGANQALEQHFDKVFSQAMEKIRNEKRGCFR